MNIDKNQVWLTTLIQKDGRRFYLITGATFAIKETIKEHGFSWDTENKFWYHELPAGAAKDCSDEVRAHFAKIGKMVKDLKINLNSQTTSNYTITGK